MKFLLRLGLTQSFECDWPVLPRLHEQLRIGTGGVQSVYRVLDVTYSIEAPFATPGIEVYAQHQSGPRVRPEDRPQPQT